MFTRRTATVTISAPDASMAARVSAKSRYLPVPTIRRERYALPPSCRRSSATPSASADELHDFDHVALAQSAALVVVARQDVEVDLDRDAARAQSKLADQLRDRHAVAHVPRLAVQHDVHAQDINAATFLYNLGTIWLKLRPRGGAAWRRSNER